jgi:hypothetical protein
VAVVLRKQRVALGQTRGILFGTLTAADIGTNSNVVISVTDGKATTKLAPFAITVSGAPAS